MCCCRGAVVMQEDIQFGTPEERLLRITIESTNNAGFALALQAFATLLLGGCVGRTDRTGHGGLAPGEP